MSEPSLALGLDTTGVSVVVHAGRADLPLDRLAARWRSARRVNATTLEVDLDDVLAGLSALADWPEPASVVWESELKQIVADSILDARAAAHQLNGHDTVADDIQPLQLAQRWIGPLTTFQLRDVHRLLTLAHSANFSVPGAGKTRVALAVYEAMRSASEVDRMLVVSPKSAYESWVEEAQLSFDPPPKVAIYDGSTVSANTELLLVNYERLPEHQRKLGRWLSVSRSMMVLDEAHRMKLGSAGAYGSACLALGPRARRRLILTGTPAPNGAEDLKSLFAFVWPGEGRRVVERAVANGDLRRASAVLKPFYTRTTKTELDLPPVNDSIRRLELPPLHRELYDALIGQMSQRFLQASGDFQAIGRIVAYLLMAADSPSLLSVGASRYEPLAYRVPPLEFWGDPSIPELLRTLPDYEFSPKYAETISIVSGNAATGRKTIVWSTFIRSLNTLSSLLADYAPATVHGGTEDRDQQLRRFREDPDCMVLLSNPATLGEGISLHHVCHDAVYVDRDFAAGRYLQSLDRIHRLGLPADTVTNVTVLSSIGTVDEVVEQRLRTKLAFLGRVLDDPAVEALGDLSEEDGTSTALGPADLALLMRFLRVQPAA
jgi:SNF2 family DNA or RNA helicase